MRECVDGPTPRESSTVICTHAEHVVASQYATSKVSFEVTWLVEEPVAQVQIQPSHEDDAAEDCLEVTLTGRDRAYR